MVAVDNSDINHGHFERVACIIFISITPTFLIARFLSRILSKQLGKDDWAALSAFVFTMSCNILTFNAFPHGWGRHKKHLSPRNLQICLILHWTFQIVYKLAVCMNKVSILLLYMRIMPQKFYRMAIFFLLGFISLFALATTIAGVFQCIPVDKAWSKSKPGHCYNLVEAWYANAVFSITTDLLILMLPMHMVYKLQRDKREKLLLYGVFGVGIFVTFTSIMRFFALKSAKNPDTTYDITSGFWSVIEVNVGVICVCLPPLRSLLSRQFAFLNRSRSRVQGSDGPYQNHSDVPSELVTIGGTGGVPSRNKEKKRADAEDSEEELVYYNSGNGMVKDGGIMKSTEIKVEERPTTEFDFGDNVRMKPWERQERAGHAV